METTTKVTEDQVFDLSEAGGTPPRRARQLDGAGLAGHHRRWHRTSAPDGGEGSDDSASTGSNTFLASIDPQFSTNGTPRPTPATAATSAPSSSPARTTSSGSNAYAGNGTIDLSFYTTAEAPTEINDISGFEYRLDGGDLDLLRAQRRPVRHADATIPATNDVSHTVSVRTTSTAGPSTVSRPRPVTPYAPIAAPTITSVSTGPSQHHHLLARRPAA